jgi:beta-lactam-binding protein with PASTA domain
MWRVAPAHEDESAADDTVVVPADEVTQAGEEWPVAEQYRVEPGSTSATRETVVLTQDRRPAPPRRFPPPVGPGALLAIAGAVAALILIALLVQLGRGDGAATEPTTTVTTTTPTSPGATTPSTAGRISVDDVEGLPLDRARVELERSGLRVKVERTPSTLPRDEVLSQAPKAKTQVAKGDVVTLVVSSGSKKPSPAALEVPGVVGLSASDAVVAIRDAGLEARIHLVESSTPAGTVLRQSPAEGASAPRGSSIRLDVAKSRPIAPAARIEVPDLVGGSVADARQQLRSLGLTVTVVQVRSDEPAGTVVRQSPRAGAELRKGATVRLAVSTGPQTVDVPDVTGLDEDSARSELESAGFEVRVVDQETADPTEDGVVLAQEPAGGTAVEGSVVTLTVGRLA